MTEIDYMDAITAITQRVSVAQLTGPGPSEQQVEQLYRAAFRAPDHAWMRPWRYLTIRGQGLVSLGEVFAEAGLNKDADLADVKVTKLKNMPQRAPLMIVAIANIQENAKVPPLEQRLAVGAGIQNILTAAYAMELGAIWRTGQMAYDQHVKYSLGLQDNEEIIGFIYVGHVNCKLKKPPELTMVDFVEDWPVKDSVLG
jgi:nitroreductase